MTRGLTASLGQKGQTDPYITVRRGGRREYPYQVVLCTPTGKPRSTWRSMIAEAKEWTGAVNAANQLAAYRKLPLRIWGTE